MPFEFDLGVSLMTEYDSDEFLGAQFDALGEQDAGVPPAEQHHPYGFMGRQNDPDVDGSGNPIKGTTLFRWHEGSQEHVMALGDPRVIPNLPRLAPGESIQYGAQGQFTRHMADGSIAMYVSDGGQSGHSSYAILHPTDGWEVSTPYGRMSWGPRGLHALHSSGSRIDLGGIGGLPPPFDALASYAKIEAALVSIKGAVISLGTDGGAASEGGVTMLVQYLSYLTQAMSLITAGTTGAAALTAAQGTYPQFAGDNNGAAALATLTPLLSPIGKVV